MSFLFMLAVVVGLPWASFISYRQIEAWQALPEKPTLPKIPIYFQSSITQIVVAFLAWLAARAENITVPLKGNFTPAAAITAAALFTGGLLITWLDVSKKGNSSSANPHLPLLLPKGFKERVAWLVAIAVAAICEEYIYRGVLFALIESYFQGSWPLAAILSAVVFGFGHGAQGEKAILLIIPFGFVFQLIVFFSGGLLMAIVTHFLYNASVDLLYAHSMNARAKNSDVEDNDEHQDH